MKRTLLSLLIAGIINLNSCSEKPQINEIKNQENKVNSKMTIHETGKKIIH